MRNIIVSTQLAPREVEEIDRLVEEGYYLSRSEAVRSLVRMGLNFHRKGEKE